MAPNHHSSDEEDEGSSEENEEQEESEAESEEEDEEGKTSTPVPKKPLAVASNKPEVANPQSSSSDESGSDSGTESESPRPNAMPDVSKPAEDPSKSTKKPRSRSSSATPAPKRQADSENTTNRESKRKKKAAEVVEDTAKKVSGDDSKKQLFQRLWSEEDEIVILKGMIDYKAKKGSDPVADMNDFHDFIKNSLHIDVSKTQLSDKMRRLKKKYVNNASRGKKGEDPTFSKPHEQKAYELSKKVWGSEANGNVNGKAQKNKTKKVSVSSPERAKEGTSTEVEINTGALKTFQVGRGTGESSLEDMIIKEGLELITGSKKSELEEKWKKLRVEEMEHYLKRVELIREQTKLVLEALKSSGL